MRFPLHYIGKVSKFVVSNAMGTVVDTLVLWVCSHFIFADYGYVGEYLVSPLISFECAVFANFCCSFFFIWKDRVEKGSLNYFFRKYVIYNLSASMTFMIKMGFLLLFEAIFGWNVVICNLAALCISGVLNFSLGEWVIFRKH